MGKSKTWNAPMTPDGGGQTSAPKLGRGPAGAGAPDRKGIEPGSTSATGEGSSEGSPRRSGQAGSNKSSNPSGGGPAKEGEYY